MNSYIDELLKSLPASLLGSFVWAVLVLFFQKSKLMQRQVTLWKVLLIVGIVIFVVVAFVTPRLSSSRVEDLSNYLIVDLVSDDTDGSDFGWIPGNRDQTQHPSLVDVTMGGISGRFVHYPVELRSTEDASGYSSPRLTARLQRGLRNYERDIDMNALLATIYIESSESTNISVNPYLVLPEYGTAYLGFGQVVPTNQWTLIQLREVTDSNRYTEEFFDDLFAVRDEYSIQDLGYLRMVNILSVPRDEGSAVGLAFRLLSDKGQDVEDALAATIYISSLTFVP